MEKTILEVLFNHLDKIVANQGSVQVLYEEEEKQSTLKINNEIVLTHPDPDNKMYDEVGKIIDNYRSHAIKTLSILSMKINQTDFHYGVNTLTGEVVVIENGHTETFKSVDHFNYIFPMCYNI